MAIEIDPALVSYGDPDPRSGLAQVYYAGVSVPYLCGFPVRPDEHGAASARRVAVVGIERRLADMSNHERLQLVAAVRAATHPDQWEEVESPAEFTAEARRYLDELEKNLPANFGLDRR